MRYKYGERFAQMGNSHSVEGICQSSWTGLDGMDSVKSSMLIYIFSFTLLFCFTKLIQKFLIFAIFTCFRDEQIVSSYAAFIVNHLKLFNIFPKWFIMDV